MSQTVTDYATGTPLYRILGGGGGGGDSATAESMTTTERTAITPDAGVLIWDTDLEKLFVGDGSTAGGVEVQGGGGEGTVTGIEASVSGNTATISATGSTTSVKLVGVDGTTVSEGANGEIQIGGTGGGGDVTEAEFQDLSDGTQSITKDLKNARFVEAKPRATPSAQNALTLLHISDLHGDSNALNRIVAKGTALGTLVDDMIFTGDAVQNYSGDGYRNGVQVPQYVGVASIADWWIPKVMFVIGNHDCANSSYNWTAVSMANRAAYYIEPYESNWGITRSAGKSYYYKDYTAKNVRLIAIDIMAYYNNNSPAEAAEQTAWLIDLLSSAITAGLHVLIACHAPVPDSMPIKCSFTARQWEDLPAPTDVNASGACPKIVSDAVATAIGNGLHFIGYLTGHWHRDDIWDVRGDRTQLMYGITTACVDHEKQWKNYSEQFRDTTLDAFNLFTVDTTNTRIKIVRGGGANVDVWERKREIISIDYSTGEIFDYELSRGVTSDYAAITTLTGATVALRPAGHYSVDAIGSVVKLTAPNVPSGKWGLDGYLKADLANESNLTTDSNVYLSGEIHTPATNYFSINFVDGKAVVTATGYAPLAGYTVITPTGTGSGSLYYGLTSATDNYIYFDPSINSATVDVSGATVTAASKAVTGNGLTNTILSGGIVCVAEPVVKNVGLDGFVVSSGFVTLRNVYIPTGATATEMGGTFRTGGRIGVDGTLNCSTTPHEFATYISDGGVTYYGSGTIDMGGKHYRTGGNGNYPTVFSSVTLINGFGSSGGCIVNQGDAVVFDHAIVSGCSSPIGGIFWGAKVGTVQPTLEIKDSILRGNRCTNATPASQQCIGGPIDSLVIKNTLFENNGPRTINTVASSVYISGATFTNNVGAFACMLGAGNASSANVNSGVIIDTIISGNSNVTGYVPDFAVIGGKTIMFSGCTLGSGRVNDNGTAIFTGSNKIQYIDNNVGQGHVVISSGAIVDMTGAQAAVPIAVSGAHITVETGGCTVIDAAGSSHSIAAGTYTQITSGGIAS